MLQALGDLHDQLQHTLGSADILEQELGGGGMSRVFAATETPLHRKVVADPELQPRVEAAPAAVRRLTDVEPRPRP